MPGPEPPPIPPLEPALEQCCGSGCERCVFDVYNEKLERYQAILRKWQVRSGLLPPNA